MNIYLQVFQDLEDGLCAFPEELEFLGEEVEPVKTNAFSEEYVLACIFGRIWKIQMWKDAKGQRTLTNVLTMTEKEARQVIADRRRFSKSIDLY